jgi:predicted MPP superfamily phosphohydrolase
MAMRLLPLVLGGSIYLSYFSFRFLKLFTNIDITWKIRLLVVVFSIIISSFMSNMFTLYAVIYGHFLVSSLILEVFYLIFKKYSLTKYIIPTGLAATIITSAFFIYGTYNINHLVKTTYTLTSDKIDDLRILQISDLHMGRSLGTKRLEEYVKRMQADKPDIVFLTGDIFEEQTTKEELVEASALLGQIEAPLGIYYVFGNHDPQPYTDTPTFNQEDIRNTLTKNGVIVLEDESITIDDLTILGRVDGGFTHENIKRMDSEELCLDVNQDNYIIILDHRPYDLEENASLGVDLQLSGHTHGGQLFPMRQLQTLFSDELVYGERRIGDFHAITSSGISGVGYPIKTGAPSEYVIIDIE